MSKIGFSFFEKFKQSMEFFGLMISKIVSDFRSESGLDLKMRISQLKWAKGFKLEPDIKNLITFSKSVTQLRRSTVDNESISAHADKLL